MSGAVFGANLQVSPQPSDSRVYSGSNAPIGISIPLEILKEIGTLPIFLLDILS
jgi:hypothetical protein